MRTNHENIESVNGKHSGRTKFDYEERTGAGAASLECETSYWTSTGAAQAVTLADGSEGQQKTIVHAVDAGSIAITPANYGGVTSATITLVAAGDSVTFRFLKGSWWGVAFFTQATLTGNTITHA